MLHWLANKVGNGTFVFPKYYQVGREGGREGGRRGRVGLAKFCECVYSTTFCSFNPWVRCQK
jgi:hypothetical protein